MLRTAAGAVGSLAFAPMINLGRYRVFPHADPEYSGRTIRLMEEAQVVDMLSPITINFRLMQRWVRDPESFTDADFQRYLDSGIDVFHIAVGTGGPDAHSSTQGFIGGWNSFLAGNESRS